MRPAGEQLEGCVDPHLAHFQIMYNHCLSTSLSWLLSNGIDATFPAQNGGHCQPLLFDSTPDVAAFEVRNYNTVKAYIEEHNIPCEWRSLPGCRTFWTQTLAEAAKKQVQHLKLTAPELGREVTFIDDEASLLKYRVNRAPSATLTAAAGLHSRKPHQEPQPQSADQHSSHYHRTVHEHLH